MLTSFDDFHILDCRLKLDIKSTLPHVLDRFTYAALSSKERGNRLPSLGKIPTLDLSDDHSQNQKRVIVIPSPGGEGQDEGGRINQSIKANTSLTPALASAKREKNWRWCRQQNRWHSRCLI